MGFLPSKNFIAPVFAVLVVILVGWFVFYIAPSYQQPATGQKPEAGSRQLGFLAAYEDANRDSDNDGLKDWEEILWKTEPLKSDTDGDNSSDSEEIKLGRDPLVKGPNDKLKTTEEAKAGPAKSSTLTDRISQRFAAEYLSTLGGAGGNLNDFQKKSVAESLLESIAGATLGAGDKFSRSEIQIVESPSQDFIKAYLNKIGGMLENNFAGLKESELTILDRALSTENFEELGKLTNYIKAYQKTVDALKKEKVPAPYAALHIELMNILNNAQIADTYMQATDKDPAKGLAGLSMYLKQADRTANFYKSIKNLIKSDGITFSPTDSGYHFMKYNP